ncbi:MAG: hypothetical protein J6S60_08785, partial [Oscillospiraceae bacterium]|nr:hypothetical protein [Oscillospiraceae bacterium]
KMPCSSRKACRRLRVPAAAFQSSALNDSSAMVLPLPTGQDSVKHQTDKKMDKGCDEKPGNAFPPDRPFPGRPVLMEEKSGKNIRQTENN